MTRSSRRAPTEVWQNWGRTVSATPSDVLTPPDAAGVAELLAAATRAGTRVRPVGAGHSFTSIAAPEGAQLRLDRISGVLAVDPSARRVRVGAGTGLRPLGVALAGLGLAMEILGDIDHQNVAGAISTGTHGTGAAWGNLATQVVGLELITGTGERLRIDATENAELLPAAALSLGALGVITEIELQCVPAFSLAVTESVGGVDAAIEGFPALCLETDHPEFFWFPHTDRAVTKTQRRLPADAPGRRRGPGTVWLQDRVLGGVAHEALCRLGLLAPRAIASLNRFTANVMPGPPVTDASHRVFASERAVRFREMEYVLDAAELGDALTALRRMIERSDHRIGFPVEVRCLAADELWLSPAHGRPSVSIAVHEYARAADTGFFAAAEAVFREHGGRPHWGKLHSLGRAELEEHYPRLADFAALRDRLDPARVLSNPYLRRVLGE